MMRKIFLGIAIVLDVAAIVGVATALEPVPALLIPALAAILPLVLIRPAAARAATITSTVLISVFVILGAFTVGMFFIPAALAMGAAATLTPRPGLATSSDSKRNDR